MSGDRFRWRKGDSAIPYGLWKHAEQKQELPRASDTLIIVEGESDCWAVWDAGYCCLGISGASNINCLTLDHVKDFNKIYVWQENDKAGSLFPASIKARLEAIGFTGTVKLISRKPYKDLSELFAKDPDGLLFELDQCIETAYDIVISPETKKYADKSSLDPVDLPRLSWESVEKALKSLGKQITKTGDGQYTAQCPAHPDGSPSLSITVHEDGKCLLHCFAGCSFDAIVNSLNLVEEYEQEKESKRELKQQEQDESIAEIRDLFKSNKNATVECTEDKSNGFSVTYFNEIETKKIEWLWRGYLPLGKLACLYGPANEMKTTLALDIASRITTGTKMPDGSDGSKGKVALLCSEDSAGDTLVPRFLAAGGDPSQICILDNMFTLRSGKKKFCSFADPEVLVSIEKTLSNIPDLRMIFVDPITSYLGCKDSHRVADVRSILSPISDMADRLKTSILYVNHVNKSLSQ